MGFDLIDEAEKKHILDKHDSEIAKKTVFWLRNRVAHDGREPTFEEAQNVLDQTREILKWVSCQMNNGLASSS